MVKIGKFYIFPLDTLYETLHAESEVGRLIILVFTDLNVPFGTKIQCFAAYNVREVEPQHISDYTKTINRTATSVGSKQALKQALK